MLEKHYHRYTSLDVASPKNAANIKRKARFQRLVVEQDPETGEFSVVETLRVDNFHREEGDKVGVLMNGGGIGPFPVVLRGNNDCAVDPATGMPMLLREGNHDTQEFTETRAEFIARVAADPRLLKLQGDYLEDQFMDSQVNMSSESLNHMRAADLLLDKFSV